MFSKRGLRILVFISAVTLTASVAVAQQAIDVSSKDGSSWMDRFRLQRSADLGDITGISHETPLPVDPSDADQPYFHPPAMPHDVLNEYSACREAECEPCLQSNYCCDPCRQWTFRAGAIILHRAQPDNQPLFSDPAIAGSGINANGFDPGWVAGVDASLIRHHAFQSNNDLELRYFNISSWNDAQSLRLNGTPLIIHNNPTTFITGGRDINSQYSLSLVNTELNLRRRIGNRLTVLGGYRYLQFNEQLNTQLINAPRVRDIHYNVAANNDLFGFQTGLMYDVCSSCNCCVQLYSKAGLYANHGSQDTLLTNFSAPVAAFPISGGSTQLATVGEIGINGSKRIWKNLALRGGYQVLALDGVATAPSQFPVSSLITQSGFANNDRVIFHGATLGLELTY